MNMLDLIFKPFMAGSKGRTQWTLFWGFGILMSLWCIATVVMPGQYIGTPELRMLAGGFGLYVFSGFMYSDLKWVKK